MRAMLSGPLLAAAAAAVAMTTIDSCQPRGTSRELAVGATLTALVAPRGGEADSLASLVDGRIDPSGWYCSHRPAPQRYEVMLADSEPRMIRAVGIVAGNLGPDGFGPVHVRVQTGHGPASRGEDFQAELRGRNDETLVIELPAPVRGDHVVLSVLRRSPYVTAMCVAEILVYPVDSPVREPADALVVRAVPAPPEPATPPRRGAGTTRAAPGGAAVWPAGPLDAGGAPSDAAAPATDAGGTAARGEGPADGAPLG